MSPLKKLNKEFNRPINDERDRAELVSSFETRGSLHYFQ